MTADDLAAVLLQAMFVGLAFGLRTLLHVRRTGSTGFRAGVRRNPAELAGAGGIVLAVALSLLGTALDATGHLEPSGKLDIAAVTWVGAVVATFGLALVLAAQASMGGSWRIGVDQQERTALVTEGLFSWSRNPIFLGMLVFWVAMAFLSPGVLSLAAVAVGFAAVQVQVRLVEEPYLLRMHGSAYAAYAARTGRLIPGLGRLEAVR